MAFAHPDVYPHGPPDRSEILRWGLSALVVVLAHMLAVSAFLPRAEEDAPQSGSPVVMIEFAPIAVAPPAPKTDLAPGPETPPQSDEVVPEQTEPQKEPDPTVTEEAPNPLVALPPKLEEQPQQEPQKVEEQPREATPEQTAPQSVEVPAVRSAGPEEGHVAHPSAKAIVTWQRLLLAHLERYKRYPAQAKGQQGIAKVAFTLDRDGHVVATRIAQTSRSAALDEAALAMIKRADPLPRPPDALPVVNLNITVPIHYTR